MEPTMINPPVTPAPEKKKGANVMLLAVIAAAILSLCCCGSGFPIMTGLGLDVLLGEDTANSIPGFSGLVCICAGLIPWLAVLVLYLVRRPKK